MIIEITEKDIQTLKDVITRLEVFLHYKNVDDEELLRLYDDDLLENNLISLKIILSKSK